MGMLLGATAAGVSAASELVNRHPTLGLLRGTRGDDGGMMFLGLPSVQLAAT
jgi:hypothetical protein